MDSEGTRIRYEVEIGKKGENLFKHMFPYALVSHMDAQGSDSIRMEVKIPHDMREEFEKSFRRKFVEAVCELAPNAA